MNNPGIIHTPATPDTTPSTSGLSSPQSSPEKVIKVLPWRTITASVAYPRPKPKSWIQKRIGKGQKKQEHETILKEQFDQLKESTGKTNIYGESDFLNTWHRELCWSKSTKQFLHTPKQYF